METPIETISFAYSVTAKEVAEGLMVHEIPTHDPSKVRRESSNRDFSAKITRFVGAVLVSWVIYVFVRIQWSLIEGPLTAAATWTIICANAVIAGIGLVLFAWWLGQRATEKRKLCWNIDARMTVSPKGLAETGRGVSTWYSWDYFRGMDEGKNVIILRTTLKTVFIIPKRLFRDESELTRASQLLRAFTAKAAIPIPQGFQVL